MLERCQDGGQAQGWAISGLLHFSPPAAVGLVCWGLLPGAGGQGLAEGVSLQQGVVFRKATAKPAGGKGREAGLSPGKVDRRGVSRFIGDAGTGGQRGLGELPPPAAARGASTRC